MSLSAEAQDFLSRRQRNGKQKEFFDAHAHEWDDINHNDPSKLGYISDLLDIKGGERILDVGTGTGVMIPYYLQRLRNGTVTALDFSEEMIRKASLKYPRSERLEYVVSDVCDLEPSYSYDLIVCYSCFPHFPDPRKALKAMTGALKNGGRLAIAHSSSKEFINQVHRDGGEEISKDFLPNAEIMSELYREQGIETVFSRDDSDYYVVIGKKISF
jgi:ubiquinone/menaquinone biosynthesis C-methylase UbiE